MSQIRKISEKCNELRQKANDSSTTRLVFGVEDGDIIISYYPEKSSLTISVVPNDFEQSSAEHVIDTIAKEFGRSYGDVKEFEGGAIVEYTTEINWSHN